MQNLTNNNILQSLFGSPRFSKVKGEFNLDKQDRIRVDPTTGARIRPKNRRPFKNFLRNPRQIGPGTSVVPFDIKGPTNLGQLFASDPGKLSGQLPQVAGNTSLPEQGFRSNIGQLLSGLGGNGQQELLLKLLQGLQ